MKRQTVITKKRRGPAPTGKGTLIGVRLQPGQLKSLDDWIAEHDAKLTRPDALRAMLSMKTGGERDSALPRKTEPNSQDEETGKRAK